MTFNPPNPEQDIDEEMLKRQMIDHLDSVLTQFGYTYKSFNTMARKEQLYQEINLLFNNLLQKINESNTPEDTQSAILMHIMPDLRCVLEADHVFLLKPNLRGQGMPDRALVDELRIIGQDINLKSYDLRPSAMEDYFLSGEEWKELLQQRGIEIRRHQVVDNPAIKLDSPPPFDSYRGRKAYQLPLPDYPAEIVTMVVGNFNAITRFVLVFHKEWSDDRLTRRLGDLDDVFDLLLQRLRDLREQTEHRIKEIEFNNARTEFMQDVLHQIRGSVSSLSAHVRYLQATTEGYLQSELRRLYKSIQVLRDSAESSYLATEKRSILDIYPEREEVFYGETWISLLREYCDIFSGEAQSCGVQGPFVIERGFENFRPIRARKNLIKLVIFNLVQNAVKYSRRGRAVHLEGQATATHMEVKLTNFGLGPDIDELADIFQRHFRSRVVKTNIPTGTGIGLYLSKKIMEAHGGTITLTSSPVESDDPTLKEVVLLLRFPALATAEIPVLPEEERELPLPDAPLSVQQGLVSKPSILYIEDEHYKHEYLIKLLARHFSVIHAHDGERALELLDQDQGVRGSHEIQLILLDIRLAGRSQGRFTGNRGGIELARAILQEHGYRMPVIAYTGDLVKVIEQELQEIGVTTAISRTQVSEDELIQLVWTHLGYY